MQKGIRIVDGAVDSISIDVRKVWALVFSDVVNMTSAVELFELILVSLVFDEHWPVVSPAILKEEFRIRPVSASATIF